MEHNSTHSKQPKGLIVFMTASIVAILTRNSSNKKTGNMSQLWILNRVLNPVMAQKTGEDVVICGSCPLRHVNIVGPETPRCYVNVGQAPLSIWRAFNRGVYTDISVGLIEMDPIACHTLLKFQTSNKTGKLSPMRLGAYGDPAFLPIALLRVLTDYSAGWTGYTHAWKGCNGLYSEFLMASVETEADACWAQSLGWRTFRIANQADFDARFELMCPASKEGGNKTTCAQCKLCTGTNRGLYNATMVGSQFGAKHPTKTTVKSVVIVDHASGYQTRNKLVTIGA
jgi:hypothetical protein